MLSGIIPNWRNTVSKLCCVLGPSPSLVTMSMVGEDEGGPLQSSHHSITVLEVVRHGVDDGYLFEPGIAVNGRFQAHDLVLHEGYAALSHID